MFLSKYLNSIYIDLVYDNYAIDYINSIDIDNFDKVYNLFIEYKFNYVNDIILNYLEIFNINYKCVENAIKDIIDVIGNDYISIISKNMTLLDKVIDIADEYDMKEI